VRGRGGQEKKRFGEVKPRTGKGNPPVESIARPSLNLRVDEPAVRGSATAAMRTEAMAGGLLILYRRDDVCERDS
jgi:hypothetical protein